MTDASITATADIHIVKLIERVQSGDPEAAREIAARAAEAIKAPNKRVGTVFRLKQRGGRPPSFSERVQERDPALCELTELQPGKTQNDRIRLVQTKYERYAANGWPHERDKPEDTGNRERDLLRKIMRTGLPIPGERQHRKIMRARAKK